MRDDGQGHRGSWTSCGRHCGRDHGRGPAACRGVTGEWEQDKRAPAGVCHARQKGEYRDARHPSRSVEPPSGKATSGNLSWTDARSGCHLCPRLGGWSGSNRNLAGSLHQTSRRGAFAQKPHGGLIMFPNDYSNLYRNVIMAPAALHNLPAIYPFREYPKFWGGLISYGVNTNYLYQGEASY